jgi:Ion channel
LRQSWLGTGSQNCFASSSHVLLVEEQHHVANLPPAAPGPNEFATMLYFSLATLTTTGYGEIVPVNQFARSLANLEPVIRPFYLAITVARLVTLELEDRRGQQAVSGPSPSRADKIPHASR